MRGPHGDPMGPMVGPQGPIGGEGGTCKISENIWKYLEIHWTNWFLELLPSSFVPELPKTVLPGSFRALGCSKTRAFWTLGFYLPGTIPFWSDFFIRKEISCGNLFPVTRKTLLYRLVQISANLPVGNIQFAIFLSENLSFRPNQGRGNSLLRANQGRRRRRLKTRGSLARCLPLTHPGVTYPVQGYQLGLADGRQATE